MKQPSNAPDVSPRLRGVTFVLLILTIAAGIASRHFPTHLPPLLQKNAGDILWSTALYFLLVTLSPRSFPGRVLVLTIILGAVVEGLKLVHLPQLDTFRASTAGGLLLGHAFSASNIACYAVGAVLAVILDSIITWRPNRAVK